MFKKLWRRPARASFQFVFLNFAEYGAVLAFVAVLVALMFGCTEQYLASYLSSAFSAVAGQLNRLAGHADSATTTHPAN